MGWIRNPRIHRSVWADWFLDTRAWTLSDRERAWVSAQREAWLSIWQFKSIRPGLVTAHDLLTGVTRTVREIKGSESMNPGSGALVRLAEFEGEALGDTIKHLVRDHVDPLSAETSERQPRPEEGDEVTEMHTLLFAKRDTTRSRPCFTLSQGGPPTTSTLRMWGVTTSGKSSPFFAG